MVSTSQSVESDKNSTKDNSNKKNLSTVDITRKVSKKRYNPILQGCRAVDAYERLNWIQEGTYGVVVRAREVSTNKIYALKKFKLENEREGFPITSVREINTLIKSKHENIVHVREVVTGLNMDHVYMVMEFVEHDLRSLMQNMSQPFLMSEVKTLFIQLMKGIDHLHSNWIIHRDIKTSNLLLSNKGVLKICDFGLAREYGSPIKPYTPIVVTLWYRAPELLLGSTEYGAPIDIWSCGCVLSELITNNPLFPGKTEIETIGRIFGELGTPTDKIWPGPPAYSDLPYVKKFSFNGPSHNRIKRNFDNKLSALGLDLLNKLLTYDPKKRVTTKDTLSHDFFNEHPFPVPTIYFPTWPAKHEVIRKNKSDSPPADSRPSIPENEKSDDNNEDEGFTMKESGKCKGAGFTLKF